MGVGPNHRTADGQDDEGRRPLRVDDAGAGQAARVLPPAVSCWLLAVVVVGYWLVVVVVVVIVVVVVAVLVVVVVVLVVLVVLVALVVLVVLVDDP